MNAPSRARRTAGSPPTAGAERFAAASAALGGAVAGALWLVPILPRGGLAPIVVAAGVALIVGVPAALAEWRTPADPDPAMRAAATSLADVGGILLASCALAWVAGGSWVGLALALAAWPIGGALTRRPAWIGIPALVSAIGLAALALVHARTAPPWTLLQPEWSDWGRFLGPALLGALWLVGAGTGRWSQGTPRPPGAVRAPLAAAGVGIALATAIAVDQGALFEATLGASTRSLPGDALLGLAGISLVGATAFAPRSDRGVWLRPAAGAVLTLGLWATGEHVRPWIWAAVVPATTAFALGMAAVRASGVDRPAAAVGALLAAGALVLSWPGLPGRVVDAVLVGGLLVLAFWFVATRSVLARRAT